MCHWLLRLDPYPHSLAQCNQKRRHTTISTEIIRVWPLISLSYIKADLNQILNSFVLSLPLFYQLFQTVFALLHCQHFLPHLHLGDNLVSCFTTRNEIISVSLASHSAFSSVTMEKALIKPKTSVCTYVYPANTQRHCASNSDSMYPIHYGRQPHQCLHFFCSQTAWESCLYLLPVVSFLRLYNPFQLPFPIH